MWPGPQPHLVMRIITGQTTLGEPQLNMRADGSARWIDTHIYHRAFRVFLALIGSIDQWAAAIESKECIDQGS